MTDREKDVAKARELVGKNKDFIHNIWNQFESGWDGAWCSETACCISYLAGNLDKIYVSNYAEGLVRLYKAHNRFGTVAEPGAFIWFDYHDGNGISHTGRVVAVDNAKVYTVEGNIGGLVVERSYAKNSSIIYGYGYPNYDDKDDDTPMKDKFVNNAIKDIVLKKGCTYYNLVMFVQEYLHDKGFYNGYIDGDFGDYTVKSVKKWQTANALQTDGIIGRYSWSVILGI